MRLSPVPQPLPLRASSAPPGRRGGAAAAPPPPLPLPPPASSRSSQGGNVSYRPSARQPPRWLRSAIEAATQRSSSGSVAEESDPRAEAPHLPPYAAAASGALSPGHAPLAARSSSFRSWRSATSAASSVLGEGTATAGSQRLAGPSPRRAPTSAAAVQLLDDGRSTTTIAFSRRTDPAGAGSGGAALLRSSSSASEAPPTADDPTAVPAVRVVRVEKHTPGRPAAAEWRDAGDREALLRNAATDPDGVITLASGGARSPLRLAVWSRNAAEETGGSQGGGPEPKPRAGASDRRWGAGLLSEPASLAPSEALLDLAAAPVDGRSSSPDSLAADGAAAPVLRRVTPLDGLGRPAKASYTYAQRWKQQPAHHAGASGGASGATVGSGRAPPVPKPALPPAGTGRRPGSAPAVGRRPGGATARSAAATSQAPSLSEPPQQQQQRVASPPAGKGAPLDSTFGQAAADPSCLTQLLQRGPFVGSRPHALSVTAGGRAARSVMASRRAAEADDAHPVAAMALYDPSSRTRQFVEATPGASGSEAPADGAAASAAPDGRILSRHASPLRRAHAAAAAQAPAPLSRDDVITVLTPLGGREGGGTPTPAAAAAPDVYIVRQQKHWGPTLQPPPPPAAAGPATELRYVAAPGQAAGTPVSTLSAGASPLESSLAALSPKGRRTLPGRGAAAVGAKRAAAAVAVSSSGGGALSSLLEGPLLGGLLASSSANSGGGDAGGGAQVLSTVPGSVRAASHLPTPLHRVLAGAAAASALTFSNERRVGSVILRDVQRV